MTARLNSISSDIVGIGIEGDIAVLAVTEHPITRHERRRQVESVVAQDAIAAHTLIVGECLVHIDRASTFINRRLLPRFEFVWKVSQDSSSVEPALFSEGAAKIYAVFGIQVAKFINIHRSIISEGNETLNLR
jgi:hypothetical protein